MSPSSEAPKATEVTPGASKKATQRATSLATSPATSGRRLLGLETEYAFRFSPAARNPGNDVLYEHLLRAMREQVAVRPGDVTVKKQVFTENGGAFCYEHLPYAVRGGMLEGATPECAGAGQLVLYQKAQERLLERCLRQAEEALDDQGFPGKLGLLRNCRDAEGNVYGAQENYEAEFARGPSLVAYRVLLALLLPVVLVHAFLYWALLAFLLTTLVILGIAATFASFLVPTTSFGRWMRRSLDEDSRALEDFFGRIVAHAVLWLSWPLHLPFALLLRAFAFRRVRRQGVAFLLSRPIVTGCGGVDEKGDFYLSEKAAAIRRLTRLSVHPADRPIFDTGNLLKPLMMAMELQGRPLLGLFRRRQRLQLSLSDANRAQVAEFLKVGMTSMIFDMAEANVLKKAPQPRRPIDALHVWSKDPTLETKIEMRDGEAMTALEVQRWYFEQARDWLRQHEAPSLEYQQVIDLWGQVLTSLERRDFGALVGTVDWVTKRFLLEKCADPDQPDVLKTIDLRYHELEEGYFQRLEAIGQAPQLVSEEAIEAAMEEPPSSTPAFLRGRLIRNNVESPEKLVVSWDSVRVGGRLGGRVGGKVIPFRRPGLDAGHDNLM